MIRGISTSRLTRTGSDKVFTGTTVSGIGNMHGLADVVHGKVVQFSLIQ